MIVQADRIIVDKIKLIITDHYIEKHRWILEKIKENRINYPESIICKGAIYCISCCFKKICSYQDQGFNIFDHEIEILTAINERLNEVNA
jgi:hypothetical protein